jgi:haloalkane dehalogenase
MTHAPLPKRSVSVLGHAMAYHEQGEGPPVLFLHGNPTSSYIWRDVVAGMDATGRLIVPDLIGMGDSAKLPSPGPDTYRFATHRRYLDAFIDAVAGPRGPLVLVLHDWGSALGFDWANRNRSRVRGIAYMEALVRPIADWNEFSEKARPIFEGFRSGKGETLVIERNMFIERVLPGSMIRTLDEAEMEEYRRPFTKPQDRWPTLTFPREIPIAGTPADVAAVIEDYSRWLPDASVSKLFVNAEPGALLTGALREFCRTWHNQEEVTVAGLHYIQEDSGAAIGQAIAGWIGRLPA